MKLTHLMLQLTVLIVVYCVFLVGMYTSWWVCVVVAALVVIGNRRYRNSLWASGTARWADIDDLKDMIDAKEGVILGTIAGRQPNILNAVNGLFDRRVAKDKACERFIGSFSRPRAPLVRLAKGKPHLSVFSPTGGGKGVSFVNVHGLTCPDSTVFVDFKGEIARITARHREKAFGHRCVFLDPMKMFTQHPDSLNVVDYIDKDSPTAIDDCQALAEAMVVRTGKEADSHWLDSSEIFIASILASIVQYGQPGSRSLQGVRAVLADPAKVEQVIAGMCESDAWEGLLGRLGSQLKHFKDKELGSVLTSAARMLRFLDTLAIVESTKQSTFDPAELRRGKFSVYLILPPDYARVQSPLLRLWIGSMIRAVIRGGLQETNKVHLVLDESSSLGHMGQLADALAIGRGYGLRLQFFYQDLGQLKKCWPDGGDQTLLANTNSVFFGVNDYATAEHVSNRLGEETILVGGTSKGCTRQDGEHGNTTKTYSENEDWKQQARKLLKPEEVIQLPERGAITFTPGVPPIYTTLIRHYEGIGLNRPLSPVTAFVVSAVLLAAVSFLAVFMTQKAQQLGRRVQSVPSNAGILQPR